MAGETMTKHRLPTAPESRQQDPEQAIAVVQFGSGSLPVQDGELLPQGQVLGDQGGPGKKQEHVRSS
jgi:hypothetical protein